MPGYFAEMGTIGKTGRVLFPNDGSAAMSDGGQVATRTLSSACRRGGVTIKTSPRVQKVILSEKGEVIGVEARSDKGAVRNKANKAVIFATGGFTRDPKLRANFPSIPVYRAGSARAGLFREPRIRTAHRSTRYERPPWIKGATLEELAANIDSRMQK